MTTKKNVLGRGLSALLEDINTDITVKGNTATDGLDRSARAGQGPTMSD